jgi:hypothetical protein
MASQALLMSQSPAHFNDDDDDSLQDADADAAAVPDGLFLTGAELLSATAATDAHHHRAAPMECLVEKEIAEYNLRRQQQQQQQQREQSRHLNDAQQQQQQEQQQELPRVPAFFAAGATSPVEGVSGAAGAGSSRAVTAVLKAASRLVLDVGSSGGGDKKGPPAAAAAGAAAGAPKYPNATAGGVIGGHVLNGTPVSFQHVATPPPLPPRKVVSRKVTPLSVISAAADETDASSSEDEEDEDGDRTPTPAVGLCTLSSVYS